jgi:hypothetical protein
VLRRVAKFAVVVTVAAPGFSRGIADQDVARWADAGGVAALIEAAWTEGEAAERQISVSDDDVDDATAPPHDGLSTADRRYEARVSLLDAALKQPILQAAAQSVTPQQIDEYVRQHPKLGPERRKARAIRARSARDAIRIKAAIERGLTWTAAARRYKADVTHDAGVAIDKAPPRTIIRQANRLPGDVDPPTAAAAARPAEGPGVGAAGGRGPAAGEHRVRAGAAREVAPAHDLRDPGDREGLLQQLPNGLDTASPQAQP